MPNGTDVSSVQAVTAGLVRTCHLRHAGLYDGTPLKAPSFVVKM